MSEPLLKVEDLAVAYGRVEAVRGISLEVNAGEFVAVIGSNGAGKSSTLKALARVQKPTGGSVIFDGKAVQGCQAHEMVIRGLAMVPEGRHVFADQTIEDNLLLGAYLHTGRDKGGVRDDIERMFDLFPRLKERRTQFAGSLSGGEQQMLAIARGLLSRPKLLMIDELSLGLAPKILDFLFPVLADLNRQGLAILLVEQLAARALSVSTRGYVMENGRIVASGPSQKLAQDANVMEAYLGKQKTSKGAI